MLLKSADDKSKRLALLEDLQKSPFLDFQQKKWLREELQRCKKGIQGEREAFRWIAVLPRASGTFLSGLTLSLCI